MLTVHAQKLGDVAIVCLRGRIVIGETGPLCNVVHSLSDVGIIVLDLARVRRVDAHGLGVLLELYEQTRSNGIQLKLINVTKSVRKVLELSRLDTVFEVEGLVAHAIYSH